MEGLVVLGKKPHYVRAFDHWLANLLRYRKTHSIPNAIQPLAEGRIDFRNKWNLGSKLIVLCVAGYSPRKDQLLVLKGFLDAKIPNSVMVFIGPTMSDYGLRLVDAASSHKGSVLILHDIPRYEVEAAIKNCDVAILGSQSEMQPIFLLEAMSEAKPWICPLVGAVDELEGGIICKRTPSGLSAALSSLQAEDRRLLLGAKGKAQWQSDFSTDVVFDKWHEILSRAVTAGDARTL
jgi:glycosyltransferase involved in cell wall biosynthesis